MADGPCPHCIVAAAVLSLYAEQAKPGSEGAWITGIIDAAAEIAAVHARAGRETAIRDKLSAGFIATFDRALSITLANKAKEVTRQ